MHDIESAIDIVNGHFNGAKAPVSQAAWFVCRAAIAEALKPSHNIPIQAKTQIAAEMLSLAEHPCEAGYQPIYPATLRRWARQLLHG